MATARRWTVTVTAAALAAASLVVADVEPAAAVQAPPFVRAWGAGPLQDGDLVNPASVAVGTDGEVFVVDNHESHRVLQVFDRDGTFLRSWASPSGNPIAVSSVNGNVFSVDTTTCSVSEVTDTGTPVQSFGSCGDADGQMNSPRAIAAAPDGGVYVLERSEVHQFGPTGQFVRRWGASGQTNGKLDTAWGVAVGPSGEVWVSDRTGIQRFTATGQFVLEVDAPLSRVAVGPDGSVYTAYLDGDSVSQYTSAGVLVRTWGTPSSNRPGRLDAPPGSPSRPTVRSSSPIQPTTGCSASAPTAPSSGSGAPTPATDGSATPAVWPLTPTATCSSRMPATTKCRCSRPTAGSCAGGATQTTPTGGSSRPSPSPYRWRATCTWPMWTTTASSATRRAANRSAPGEQQAPATDSSRPSPRSRQDQAVRCT